MIDLTPERRAELREFAERARPFVRHGGTGPAAVYVPAADLLTLLNDADERDRLAAGGRARAGDTRPLPRLHARRRVRP